MRFFVVLFLAITGFTGCVTGNFLECETQEDCLAEEATCVSNLCECPIGKTFSGDGTKCLEVVLRYGDSCTDDTQCASLFGKYQCYSGTCQCQSGYRYYHGFCIPALGLKKFCSKNEDCFVSHDPFAMICESTRCVCNEGYYSRGDYDCRPKAKALDDACAMDSDCQFIPDSYCNNGCVTVNHISQMAIFEEDLKKRSSSLDHLSKAIGSDCSNNEDCEDQPNSYCSPLTKKCVCKRGYFYNSRNGCIGELALDIGCKEDSDCKITLTTCNKDGMCICPTSHYYAPGLDKCVKAAAKVNNRVKCITDQACNVWGPRASCVTAEGDLDSYCECNFGTELSEDSLCVDTMECSAGCASDEDCDIINSICNKNNGQCVCPDNYRLEDDICLPNIGGTCDDQSRWCEIENSECDSNKKCSCLEGHLNLDSTTCIKEAGIGEECSMDQQCIGQNTDCQMGTCQCQPQHQEINGSCKEARVMGDYCTNANQCHVVLAKTVLCRNSKCQCASDARPTDDNVGCKPRSLSISVHQPYILMLLIAMLVAFCL